MIHRIAIGRAVLLDLREVDPVASRRLASLLQRPRQTSDSRVKYGDVLRHHLRRVALWVDGEEERLNALGARAEFIHDKRYLVEGGRSEEHTSELQSLMRISYAVFCLNKKIT